MGRVLQWVKADLTSMGLAAYVVPMPPAETPKHLVIRRHLPALSKRELALLRDIASWSGGIVAIVSDPLRTVRSMVDRGLVVEREPGIYKLTPAGEEVRLAWKRAGW